MLAVGHLKDLIITQLSQNCSFMFSKGITVKYQLLKKLKTTNEIYTS